MRGEAQFAAAIGCGAFSVIQPEDFGEWRGFSGCVPAPRFRDVDSNPMRDLFAVPCPLPDQAAQG